MNEEQQAPDDCDGGDDKSVVIPFRSDRETRDQLDRVVTARSEETGIRLDRSKVLRLLVAEAHRKLVKKGK